MKMLKDAKSKKDIHMENWLILIEQLMTIYILIKYPLRIRLQLVEQSLTMLQRANVTMHQSLKEKYLDIFLVLNDAARRYKAMENEAGLHHLREYIVHWLEWLRQGSSTNPRIARKSASHSMYSAGKCEDPLEAELDKWIQRSAEQALPMFGKIRVKSPWRTWLKHSFRNNNLEKTAISKSDRGRTQLRRK